MSSYIFETVEFEKKYPVNAFVASIQSSSFHWHYEYELLAGSQKSGAYSRPVVKALAYMEENYSSPALSLEDTAAAAGLSPRGPRLKVTNAEIVVHDFNPQGPRGPRRY